MLMHPIGIGTNDRSESAVVLHKGALLQLVLVREMYAIQSVISSTFVRQVFSVGLIYDCGCWISSAWAGYHNWVGCLFTTRCQLFLPRDTIYRWSFMQ